MVEADVWVTDAPQKHVENGMVQNLEPEPQVESESEEIMKLAVTLRRETQLETARSHYEWVYRNIQSESYSPQDRGALWAVRNKKGDCTEMAQLFAALCRASQIPARVMGGYICPNNSNLNANQFHNWAEFFDGSTWQIVDPQSQIFMKKQSDYIATEIVQSDSIMGKAHRYRFSGDGLKVEMK